MRISDWSSDVCSSDLEDVAKARKFGTESFAESLIPVKDSLEAALSLTDQTADAWKEGVEATLRQLNTAFERNLLKEVAPAEGDKFDPHVHQAISAIPSSLPEGTVAQLLQKGYTIAERVRSEEHTSERQSIMRISYAV